MPDFQQTRLKLMLNSYERQLINARRLAKFRVRRRLEAGLDPDDPDPGPNRAARATQIAEALYMELLFYPDAHPAIVEEIREELSQALGRRVEFTYPPGGTMRIAVREENGLRHLDTEEQTRARETLRRITGAKVAEGLFENHAGINTRI
ncbi:MAG: hypothetical protein HDQ91_00770 [Desulfovibrio sp.]|nr:hypothetical protein [Desulfovibrio sp.]